MSLRSPFRRRRRGVQVAIPAEERAVLARLLDDVDGLLDDGTPGGGSASGSGSGSGGGSGSEDDWFAQWERDVAASEGPFDTRPAAERFDDPAVARLLPDAVRDDPAAAAEFRRLTEHGLRARKRAALALAAEALRRPDPVLLAPDEAQALLKGLTDVRLVIAERLGLRTDADAEQLHALLAHGAADDPRVATAALYDALTWWQEALVRAL